MNNKKKLLTREEVDSLEEGTIVNVVWYGEIKSYKYIIKKDRGEVYVATNDDDIYYRRISFVGKERIHTRVWLDEE